MTEEQAEKTLKDRERVYAGHWWVDSLTGDKCFVYHLEIHNELGGENDYNVYCVFDKEGRRRDLRDMGLTWTRLY